MNIDRIPHRNMFPTAPWQGGQLPSAVPLPNPGPGAGYEGRPAVPLPNPGWRETPPWVQELQNRMSDPIARRQGTGLYAYGSPVHKGIGRPINLPEGPGVWAGVPLPSPRPERIAPVSTGGVAPERRGQVHYGYNNGAPLWFTP